MSKFEVGQKVFVTNTYRRGERFREVTVTKVGRKYAYADGTSFHKETGEEAGAVYRSPSYLYTAEERDEIERRSKVILGLREAGLELRYGVEFTTERLERILAAATSTD